MLFIFTYVQSLLAARMRDERGVTAIEYGLLATFIALVMVAGATLLGKELDALFTTISQKV